MAVKGRRFFTVYLSVPNGKSKKVKGCDRFASYEEARDCCTRLNKALFIKEGKPKKAPFVYYYVDTQGVLPILFTETEV